MVYNKLLKNNTDHGVRFQYIVCIMVHISKLIKHLHRLSNMVKREKNGKKNFFAVFDIVPWNLNQKYYLIPESWMPSRINRTSCQWSSAVTLWLLISEAGKGWFLLYWDIPLETGGETGLTPLTSGPNWTTLYLGGGLCINRGCLILLYIFTQNVHGLQIAVLEVVWCFTISEKYPL